MNRILSRTFPGEIKPIPTLPGRPLQTDAGRFRVLFQWNQGNVVVIAVFPKADQRKVFRGLKARTTGGRHRRPAVGVLTPGALHSAGGSWTP